MIETLPPVALRIGPLELRSVAMLAPMAGVCDGPFKRVVRRFDRHSLLSTELVNGEAWLRGSHEMAARMLLHPDESPVAIQLSGHDPGRLDRVAVVVTDLPACVTGVDGERDRIGPQFAFVGDPLDAHDCSAQRTVLTAFLVRPPRAAAAPD